MNLDNAFGIHADALALRVRRAEVLSRNMANAETPNYQARDFDFSQTLQNVMNEESSMQATHPQHMTSSEPGLMGADLQYRIPNQPSIDGNTVDIQTERAEFTQNAMQYQASLRFINGRISGLLTAIKGE